MNYEFKTKITFKSSIDGRLTRENPKDNEVIALISFYYLRSYPGFLPQYIHYANEVENGKYQLFVRAVTLRDFLKGWRVLSERDGFARDMMNRKDMVVDTGFVQYVYNSELRHNQDTYFTKLKPAKFLQAFIKQIQYNRDAQAVTEKQIADCADILQERFGEPSIKDSEEFKIIRGAKIARLYNYRSHFANSNTLGSSCMRDDDDYGAARWYALNSNVRLFVLLDKESQKVKARAILWHNCFIHHDKEFCTLQDRIFSIDNRTYKLMLAEGLKRGHVCYRHASTTKEYIKLKSNGGHQYVEPYFTVIYRSSINGEECKSPYTGYFQCVTYPYFDTFSRTDYHNYGFDQSYLCSGNTTYAQLFASNPLAFKNNTVYVNSKDMQSIFKWRDCEITSVSGRLGIFHKSMFIKTQDGKKVFRFNAVRVDNKYYDKRSEEIVFSIYHNCYLLRKDALNYAGEYYRIKDCVKVAGGYYAPKRLTVKIDGHYYEKDSENVGKINGKYVTFKDYVKQFKTK